MRLSGGESTAVQKDQTQRPPIRHQRQELENLKFSRHEKVGKQTTLPTFHVSDHPAEEYLSLPFRHINTKLVQMFVRVTWTCFPQALEVDQPNSQAR